MDNWIDNIVKSTYYNVNYTIYVVGIRVFTVKFFQIFHIFKIIHKDYWNN